MRTIKKIPDTSIADASEQIVQLVKEQKTASGEESGKLIEVTGLTKSFDNVEAVNGITFNVNRGEVFGFLGPNGAGKITTINMLTGLARPDSGQIRIAGRDCSVNPKAV